MIKNLKKELRSLEIRALISEFRMLVGSRLDKVYQPNGQELFFQFSVKGKGKQLLRVIIPRVVYLTDSKPPMTKAPINFCVVLRKQLAGMFLESVKQLHFDRIILLEFGISDKRMLVVIELFGPGNVLLCDSDNKIIQAITLKGFRDRTINRGLIYEPPPQRGNVLEISKEEFFDLFSGEEVVRVIAAKMGLGNAYAEEACIKTGIDKTRTTLLDNEIEELYDQVQSFLTAKPSPVVVWRSAEKDEVVDVVLWRLDFYGDCEQEPASNASGALGVAYSDYIVGKDTSEGAQESRRRDKKLKIIERQEEMIISLKRKIEENKKKGELIYQHYQELQQLLKVINTARKDKTWGEIKDILGDRVLAVDAKEKKVTLELNIKS